MSFRVGRDTVGPRRVRQSLVACCLTLLTMVCLVPMMGCTATPTGRAATTVSDPPPPAAIAPNRAVAPGADLSAAEDLRGFASMADSARLADGRTIHITCRGQGSPVVILTAGAGDWGVSWQKVLPVLADRTRVCAWDRAGFGLSDPSPLPQTVVNTAQDLAQALESARIDPPYVVVGHSFGAFESLLLADRPDSGVVGMVLVDPAIPDSWGRRERVAPAVNLHAHAESERIVGFMRSCAAILAGGAVSSGTIDPNACSLPPPPTEWPEALTTALRDKVTDSMFATMASFFASNEESGRLMVDPARHFGQMPLIVLLAEASFEPPPDLPPAARAQFPAFLRDMRAAQEEYANLSTRGVHRVVPGTTHYIHNDSPDAVIDAISEVLDQSRFE